ncbi:YibE/F family protein [Tissierella praeacuta]|uniref:YibE/F family protein n=1 Tax=Tissierella praeacuta TaxID=43131 RepID=UPI000EB8B530|nr:YibE/F family protein [Tissierella praeacuta]HAE91312.1 YibE/F family protein [Tissierella sp.]
MKKILSIIILMLIIINTTVLAEEHIEPIMEKAIVLEAGEAQEKDEFGEYVQTQKVTLKITSGKYKDKIVDIENDLSDNMAYNIFVKEGDKVVIAIEEIADGEYNINIADYQRADFILYLIILFVALILIVGRMKGLKSIISLSLTIGAVFYILLPQILKGANPVPISILISIGVTIITIFLVSGVNNKSIAAILGTSSGVIIAGIISYYVGSKIHLTGLSAEEATMLMYIPQEIEFDFKNLLFAGIILGSLGAVMDVGMSIASSIEEIHSANNNLSRKELFKSGMNVGKDVMGTMTNTLILAYTGSSIPLLLLFMAYETSLIKIMNLDVIATEVIRSLSGSIGLVLTIPITALIASVLTKKIRGEDIKNE